MSSAEPEKEPLPTSGKGAYIDDSELDLRILSSRYVPDRMLKDAPSRLFRKVLRQMGEYGLTVDGLIVLINDYLRWEIQNEDPQREKEQRTHTRGNIKSGYFNSDTMTLPKLLVGLSILKAKKCRITLDVEFENQAPITVSEEVKIHNADTKSKVSEKLKK